jgi:hypothetical protein
MTKRANDFLIWRAGSSVDWDCTAADLVKEVGLSVVRVNDACRRNGWKCQLVEQTGGAGRHRLDVLMKSPYIAGRAET